MKQKSPLSRLGFLKIIISQWFQKSNQNVSPCKRRMHESLGKILLNFSTPSKPQNPFWQLCVERKQDQSKLLSIFKVVKDAKKSWLLRWHDHSSFLIPSFSYFSVLRKEFEVPPYSQSVELGSQIQLRCHPPKGVPKPRVRMMIC